MQKHFVMKAPNCKECKTCTLSFDSIPGRMRASIGPLSGEHCVYIVVRTVASEVTGIKECPTPTRSKSAKVRCLSVFFSVNTDPDIVLPHSCALVFTCSLTNAYALAQDRH